MTEGHMVLVVCCAWTVPSMVCDRRRGPGCCSLHLVAMMLLSSLGVCHTRIGADSPVSWCSCSRRALARVTLTSCLVPSTWVCLHLKLSTLLVKCHAMLQ
jgi:hypothetical protein